MLKFHRDATRIAVDVVNQVRPGDLDRPTPCAEWDLGTLLAHMVGQNHGFAAAARGAGPDLALWAHRPVGDDPAGVFAASATEVGDVFAAVLADPDARQRGWWLPEIRDGAQFPAELGLSFHFVDTVVHAWDVARALGTAVVFDHDLLDAVLPVARMVPDGPNRRVPGASFQPALPSSVDGDVLDEVLSLLGRSPRWTAPER